MRALLLGCLLSVTALFANDSKSFTEIEMTLKGNSSIKIATKEQAEKVLIAEIAKPKGGISAYWSWSIRDAFMLPNDLADIGKAGEVVWLGQLNSLNEAPLRSQPLAIYFINATTGNVFVSKRPPSKKSAEQAHGADADHADPGVHP